MRTLTARSSFAVFTVFASVMTHAALAATGPDLSTRIVIDGVSSEFTPDEALFGINQESGTPEESENDSQWGPFNDLNQVKLTWDAENLYVACDGYIWNNNMILLLDLTGGEPDNQGLAAMTDLNSWRRNFDFSEDFSPDLFFATWDGNAAPQIWTYAGPDQVTQVQSTQFLGAATFLQNTPGRAMEAAIPWNVVFAGASSRIVDPVSGAETWAVPEGMTHLRFAAVITAGPDGTGGPDSAPDNFNGHNNDSSVLVLIDNFAVVPIDDSGGIADGIPDFGIEPRARISFKRRPPIRGIQFELADLELEGKIVSPEENRPLRFRLRLDPAPDPRDDFRQVELTARVYDSLGHLVRVLYTDDVRPALQPFDPSEDVWDGRDEAGEPVRGGIYVLSVVSEPGLSRSTRAFGVVR